MNKAEALQVLAAVLERYRQRPYGELVHLMDSQDVFESTGPSGTAYQVEVQVFWDDEHKKNIRVLGAIDDGGWRSYVPLTDSFILAPDGTFVGE